MGESVRIEGGPQVPLFSALLAVNLMAAYYKRDFLEVYADALRATGDWQRALHILIQAGLREGMEQRLPIAWSDRHTKVRNIQGWTVTAAHPQGSEKVASEILQFWTHDLADTAANLGSEGTLLPELFEKPAIKFGQVLVTLPWVLGLQDNGTAAVNSLRRLGARRQEAKIETLRIERQVAQLLAARGFQVIVNWTPPASESEAGEVDVIAARDGQVFVIEVKSTYLRSTERDAWIHATSTLRKAGRQLERKLDVVRRAIRSSDRLCNDLGLSTTEPPMLAWIVDTCIECDHERFKGFLKISLEEFMIALRDDSVLMLPAEELMAMLPVEGDSTEVDSADGGTGLQLSLYPGGFTAQRLIEVVESEAVWRRLPEH